MDGVQANVMTIDTARKILSVVDQGLCSGLGEPIPGHMCVEAAVCYALGLPHSDDPKCVDPIDPALRVFVITLNDSPWSSPKARAEGMRKLAVAQLGSLGKLDSIKFAQKLAEQTIRRLLPPILRQIGLHDAAYRCEQEGTEEAAEAACSAARSAADLAAYAARNAAFEAAFATSSDAAFEAASAAHAAHADVRDAAFKAAAESANAAAHAARCAAHSAANTTEAADHAANAEAARDGVLTLMCDICIDVLRDMRAPGIALMDQVC